MKAEKLMGIRFISPDAFAYGSDGRGLALDKVAALLKGTRAILGEKGQIFFGTFPSEVRPDHVTRETIELTRRYATNKRLVIGAQSGSARMLKVIRRGHTVEDIYRAAELAAAYGFSADVDFIFGLPGETEKDAELTLKVIEDLVALGARIHAHTFMPLPQTPFAGEIPVPLSARTEKFLRTLCSRGRAFGQWEKQKLIGRTASHPL
jgi:B12-binding domain/radical SAM domain protein